MSLNNQLNRLSLYLSHRLGTFQPVLRVIRKVRKPRSLSEKAEEDASGGRGVERY